MHPALRWFIVGAGSSILFAVAICAIVALDLGDPKTPMVGNRRELVDRAAEGRGIYRFVVLGDTQKGLASFDVLLAKAMEENPAFLVHSGDLVSHNDEGHYRLARHHIAKGSLQIPMLITAGNHDIKGGTERFERDFGPTTLDFGRAPAAFIVLNTAFGEPPDAAAFEGLLKKYEGRRTMIFTHVPPFEPKVDVFTPAVGWEEFLRLCDQYKVAYVFSGHVHRYVRHMQGETVFIANGIGGDRESWQFDEQAVATMVEVTDQFVRDHPIRVPPVIDWKIELQHLAVGHVTEAYRSLWFVCWPATVGLIALVAWAAVKGGRKKAEIVPAPVGPEK